MKRRLAWSVGIALGLLAALVAAAWLLLGTQAGLRWALAQAAERLPGKLSVQKAEGRLIGPLTLTGLAYRHAGRSVALRQVTLDWSPRALLAGTLRIERLAVSGGRVALPAAAGNTSVSLPRLPIAVRIVDARLHDLSIARGGAQPIELRALELQAALRGRRLRIAKLAIRLPQASLHASGTVGLAPKTPTALALRWELELPGLAAVAGSGTVRGDWAQLRVEQRLSAPVPAKATLALIEPFQRLHWRLSLAAPQFRLRQLRPAWGTTSLAGNVEAQGTLNDATLEARLRTDAAAKAPYRVTLGAQLRRVSGAALQLSRLQLRLPQRGGELDVAGRIEPAAQRFDLHATWRKLAWPLTGPVAWHSAQGRALLHGTLRAYALTLDAQLAGARVPGIRLQAEASGDAQRLRVTALRGALLGGSIRGSGEIAWRPKLAWQLAVNARDIDPGKQWPAWTGRLAGRLTTAGRLAGDGLHASGEVAELAGVLRGYPVRGDAAVKLEGEALDIDRLQLSSGEDHIAAHGSVARQWQLAWQLDAPRLSMLLPGWEGRVAASGALSGPRAAPRVTMRLRAERIAARTLHAAKLEADVDASLDLARSSRVRLRAADLELLGERFRSAALDAGGRLAEQRLSLTAQGSDADVDIRLAGGWRDGAWRGEISRARLRLAAFGDWTLQRPVALYADAKERRASGACWLSGAARLCLDAAERIGQSWRASAAVQHLPLGPLARRLAPDVRLDGTLSAQLQAAHTAGAPTQAQLQLSLAAGKALLPAAGKTLALPYGGGRLQAALGATGLSASGTLRLEGSDRVELALALPGYGLHQPAGRRQPVRGSVQVRIANLAPLAVLSPDLGLPSGSIDASLELGGSLQALELRGRMALADGAFDVAPLGLRVRQLVLAASFAPDGRVQLRGSARSGKGSLVLEGSGRLTSTQHWQARLHVYGANFQAADTPDAQVLVSPDMTLDLEPGRINVAGEVKVPEAKIQPRRLASDVVTVSPDVTIVGANRGSPQPQRWQLGARVHLVLGNKVTFRGFGLEGKLAGDLHLTEEPGRIATGRGQLEIRNGTYRAFGQDLTIAQGRLLFAGGPVDDPGVDVRATRQAGNVSAPVVAGVQVSGTAKNPVLSLFSTPPMSQADTLSYLLTGHALSNASAAEGQLLFSAASSLGFTGGNLLAERIASTFGLQEARIQTGSTLRQSSLVLGKYLSPRLYVKYSVGLAGAFNELRIRYELSKRWALETETGLQGGADLLYTIEH